jgi:RHS repeat-associated protein
VNENGQIISYEEYYPYGSSSYRAGRTLAEVSQKRYRHSAKEHDDETGLSYHGARYYASWLGRWTAADPAGVDDSTNLFVYVGDNPINLNDPDGKKRKKPTYGAIRFSPQSQISAQEMVDMIKRNDKLEPWMKDMFVAEGREIRLTSKRLPRVPKDSKTKAVPQWFANTLFAIRGNNWFFSTGATVISEKATLAYVPDIDAESHLGHTIRGTRVTFGETKPHPTLEHAEFRKAMRQKKNPDVRHPTEGLIIVTNRYRFSEKSTIDIARNEAAIVESFFHELGAHAALIDQGKPQEVSGHTSSDYDIGLADMSEADYMAQDVGIFLEKKWDKENIDKTKALAPLETPVGVILNLDEQQDIIDKRKQDLGVALEIVEAQKAKAAAAPAGR